MRKLHVIYTLLCTQLVANGGEIEAWSTTNPLAVNGTSNFCREPFMALGDQCLFFASFAEEAQAEARQFCHSLDGELAAVTTATRFKTIVDYINENGLSEERFWIDGTDEDVEGDWRTSSGEALPMGTPFWKATLEFQEPNNLHGNENCVDIRSDPFFYYMNDVNCANVANPICEQQISSKGPTTEPLQEVDCPFFYVAMSGSCLAFLTWADLTWTEARQSCHGLSGELAAITDIEQLRAIYLYLRQEGIAQHSFWLGGSDSASEGSWTWTDGHRVPMGTPFWGLEGDIQEPDGGYDENCLLLNAEGYHYFRDANCSLLMNPMCLYLM